MCDFHRSQWRDLYHEYLQQHSQMTWGYQQQHPFSSAITSHCVNNDQCHFCSVPPSLCANQIPCHCCSAFAFPARTCYIYANRSPYHCCTDGPLPVNTGCISPSHYYPRCYPARIEPQVCTGYASRYRNADENEDDDSSDVSSSDDDNEDDYSSDSDSCKTPSLSKCKQFLIKKAEIMKKQYEEKGDNSSDGESGSDIKSFSKYERHLIKKKAKKLLKQYKEEDYSSDSCSEIPSFAFYEQVLKKIHKQLMEEEEGMDEITFKILEPFDDPKDGDSDFKDSSNEDEGEEDASDEETDETDSSDENEDAPDTKSEERAEPPKSGEQLKMDAFGEEQHKFGRMTPTTLEDAPLKQEIGEFVYGAKADAICGQETLMISEYDRICDETAPNLWPVHPIDP